MPIGDRSIGWKTCRQYLGINEFSGMDITSAAGLGAGAPVTQEVSTFGIGGLAAAAAGDMVAAGIPIPWNLNRDKKVRGRLFFAHSAAAADTPDFIIGSIFFNKLIALTTAETPEATGAITHTNVATAYALEVTDWIDLNWDDYINKNDIFVLLNVEVNGLGSASANEITVLGLELEWEIKATDSYRHKTRTEPVDAV